MSIDYEPNTDLIDDAIEVTEELRQAINRVADVVMRYNNTPNRTREDTQWLNTVVDNFNFDQKYQAVRVNCTTPTELLDRFMERRIVPQIRVVLHSSNRFYGIEFYTHYLAFEDFYKANRKAFPKYNEFSQVLSTFFHNIYTELVRDLNHNSFFPNNYYARTARRNNPYTAYFLPIEWHNQLDVTGLSSKKALNRLFSTILTRYFPDFQFKHFARFTWNYLFTYMGGGHKLESTMDFLLCCAWLRVHHKLGSGCYNSEHHHPISRHIAWCENEHKRVCLKFGFDCHSSINCPFYRESQLKRQG